MSELRTFSIERIGNIINERSTGTVVSVDPDFNHLDVDDKVGKEVFGPLSDEGIHVVAAMPRDDGMRLWFGESDNE